MESKPRRALYRLAGLLLVALLLWRCQTDTSSRYSPPRTPSTLSTPDLAEIRERGKLIAITGYNPISYFLYRGEIMGYEYELLERLARHLEVELDVRIAHDVDRMLTMLHRGEGDIVAYNLTVTQRRREQIAFSNPLTTTRQVLVQRKPDNWRAMRLHELEQQLIRSPLNLADTTIRVWVTEGSSHLNRLEHLSEEIGGEIRIERAPLGTSVQDLIYLVHTDSINFTVADENIAQISTGYYPNLDIQTPLSFPQHIAWGLRPGADDLLATVNHWLAEIKTTPTYNVIYRKYFENQRAFQGRMSEYKRTRDEQYISQYDGLLRDAAKKLGWDWRLLAALVYQESRFDPKAQSWAGAKGLMQVMPITLRQLRVSNPFDAASSLAAGTRYLAWLDNYWSGQIENPNERLKFVLGSYNVGLGHVEDARRLAEKYDHDPNTWDGHVAEFLIRKAQPAYYNDPVVFYGYCRGREPIQYVKEILRRYEQYRQLTDALTDDAG